MENDVFDFMRMKLEEKRRDYEIVILNGQCRTMERYEHMLGCVNGINEALSMLEEIEKKFLEQ